MSPESIVAFQTKMGESCRVKLFAWKSEKEKRKTAAWVLKKVLEHATGYGKPNGAKFKKQNWLHVQQIFIKVKADFNQAQQNQFTFNQFSLKVKTFRIKLNKITSSLSRN